MMVKRAAAIALLTVLVAGCSSQGDSNRAADATEAGGDVPLQQDIASDGSGLDSGEASNADAAELPRLPTGSSFSTRYAAGAAERIITPDHEMFMGGFGFCGGSQQPEKDCRISGGVHDDLEVGVVAIADTQTGEVVMFAGVDAVGLLRYDIDIMHEAVQERLLQEYGVYFEGARLIVAASHSHATPDVTGLWGPWLGDGRDEDYVTFLRDQVVDAAVEAFGALGDIEMTWALGHSPNYTDGSNPVKDDDIYVIEGHRPDGTQVFTLTRWVAHPTAYGSSNNAISADFPGTFRKRMEEYYGGLAVYLNGCIGGTYPDRPVECGVDTEAFPGGWKDPDLSPEAFMKVTCTGYQVADNAKAALDDGAVPMAETGIGFKATEFGFHPDNFVLMFAAKSAPIPGDWGDIDDPEAQIVTELAWAKVGDLTFVTTPGESLPAFGAKAKEIVQAAGMSNPVVLGLAQDWLGYLLTEEQWSDTELSYQQGISPGSDVDPAYRKALEGILP